MYFVLKSLKFIYIIPLYMLQHSRTGGHNEPSTTRDKRLHVQLRSSWWWTQLCPKHVERNNVNKFLRILKQSTSGWRFYSSYCNDVRNHEPEIWYRLWHNISIDLVLQMKYFCGRRKLSFLFMPLFLYELWQQFLVKVWVLCNPSEVSSTDVRIIRLSLHE